MQRSPMTAPLSCNRNYQLLWASQVLSLSGFNASMIAFPLLVLAVTGSPVLSGLVLGVDAAAQLVAGLPAGTLVDRWNRKKIMIFSEGLHAVAAASLVAALWWGAANGAHMVVVAAVMGVCRALFQPAEEASLPNVVAADQLPATIALNSARSLVGQLSGTAVGGFLFAVGRFVPFALDALAHSIALFALVFLRLPSRPVHLQPVTRLGHEMAASLRWVWQHRPIRVIGLLAVSLNVFFSAYFIVIIVMAQTRAVPSGEIGIMAAMLGAGGILGSLIAPYLYQMLSPYLSIIGVFWALTLITPLAIFVSNGYLMGALFAAMAFLAPTANTSIDTYQLLLTPDDLRGRLSGVMNVLNGAAGALGPAMGGLLMGVVSANHAVLLCAAGIGAVTLLGSTSSTLRNFPRQPRIEMVLPTAGKKHEQQTGL